LRFRSRPTVGGRHSRGRATEISRRIVINVDFRRYANRRRRSGGATAGLFGFISTIGEICLTLFLYQWNRAENSRVVRAVVAPLSRRACMRKAAAAGQQKRATARGNLFRCKAFSVMQAQCYVRR